MIGPNLKAEIAEAAELLRLVLSESIDDPDDEDFSDVDGEDDSLARAHALFCVLGGVDDDEREPCSLPSLLDLRRAADFLRMHDRCPRVRRWIQDGVEI